jgi:hypothetical protein
MKQTILFLLATLLVTQTIIAQSALAKLKYQDAEEAYTKEDYRLAITKLNEAEGILKATNPRILYLKIMAQSKLIQPNPYADYSLLDNTRKLSTKYLKDYENLADNDDKYREIYRVSETLAAYPGNSQDFEKQRQQKEIERAAATLAAASKEKEYDNDFMQFVYFKEYKLGLTLEETIKQYPIFKKHYNFKTDSGAVIAAKDNYSSGVLTGFYVKNNKTWGYYGTIKMIDDDAGYTAGTKKIAELVSTLTATFHFSPVEKTTDVSIKDWPGRATVYTWFKNNKIVTLTSSNISNKGLYYSSISINSFDNNLAK